MIKAETMAAVRWARADASEEAAERARVENFWDATLFRMLEASIVWNGSMVLNDGGQRRMISGPTLREALEEAFFDIGKP